MKTLVTGGIRSGKSAFAEGLVGDGPAIYLATGATRTDDASWAARVDAHQKRRPTSWTTQETCDVPTALRGVTGSTVLLDDLGHWLSRTLDELDAWDSQETDWRQEFDKRQRALLEAIESFDDNLVIVTGEVGFGLVSPYASGRLYTDELGLLNQLVAKLCDSVVLVVAGCPLVLKNPEDAS